ncbi:MAG: redoxin domain-containing protein, partial [Candidatus Lokiarchaeota archaeon]|nr:redoxin domain-containing protein [Candidatus Lokiarchaeota archaeon]MBD3352300.1 redoxin domain-containing protein [Candidatus Lokiarchaeota archaeon]
MKLLNKHLELFQQHNVKLLSISSDSPQNMNRLQQKYKFNLAFISDPRAKIAKSYKVSVYEQLGETPLRSL